MTVTNYSLGGGGGSSVESCLRSTSISKEITCSVQVDSNTPMAKYSFM